MDYDKFKSLKSLSKEDREAIFKYAMNRSEEITREISGPAWTSGNESCEKKMKKPLGKKVYGSIPHLPNSRIGGGEHCILEQQAAKIWENEGDRHHSVIVQEKLDGSNCAIANIEGKIIALTRGGYPANDSEYEHYRDFAKWVGSRVDCLRSVLPLQARICGEWLGTTHGTEYKIPETYDDSYLFAPFDMFVHDERSPFECIGPIAKYIGAVQPKLLSYGPAISHEKILKRLGEHGWRGAVGKAEGYVARLENAGVFLFMAKWVRPDKIDVLPRNKKMKKGKFKAGDYVIDKYFGKCRYVTQHDNLVCIGIPISMLEKRVWVLEDELVLCDAPVKQLAKEQKK